MRSNHEARGNLNQRRSRLSLLKAAAQSSHPANARVVYIPVYNPCIVYGAPPGDLSRASTKLEKAQEPISRTSALSSTPPNP
jgi:hypothetical protein